MSEILTLSMSEINTVIGALEDAEHRCTAMIDRFRLEDKEKEIIELYDSIFKKTERTRGKFEKLRAWRNKL